MSAGLPTSPGSVREKRQPQKARFPDGQAKTGTDAIRVGPDGTIVEWRCHYSFAPEKIDDLIAD